MKKVFIALFFVVLSLIAASCGNKADIKNTVNGSMKTYYELTDGSWKCDDIIYKYRLEIKGRLNSAACDSVYVYLSNLPDISFEQAWRASGLSSNLNDYFAVGDAVLVEMGTE